MTREEIKDLLKFIIRKCDLIINNKNYTADDYVQDKVEDIGEMCYRVLDGQFGEIIEDTLELTQERMTNMKVPDKIYIQPNAHDGWFEGNKPNDNFVEYIRKDALLEWLKIAVECYSHPDTVNVVDSIRCEGKKWAFQDVINEIELI